MLGNAQFLMLGTHSSRIVFRLLLLNSNRAQFPLRLSKLSQSISSPHLKIIKLLYSWVL